MRSPETLRPAKVGWVAAALLVVATAVAVAATGHSAATGPTARQSAAAPARPAPHRIISLIPAATEMLFAIGAGDDVVGVSSFDHYPPAVETRPRVGALVDPDFERILSLRPDLVVVYATQTDLIARLSRAHIAMFPYQHAGLADVMTTIRALGARIDHVAEAEREARSIERELDAIRASVRARPRPRTALVFNRDAGSLRGIFVSGGIGFLNDMLEVAGGANVFADVHQESLQVSTELLLARAPDVILELRPNEGWTAARFREELDVWKGLPSLPAVRNGRVHILADDRLLIPGPRVAQGVRLMADALK